MKIAFYKNSSMWSIIGAVITGLLGLGAGWLIGETDKGTDHYRPFREENSQYSFINPLLFVDVSEDIAFPKFTALKERITEYAKKAEASDDIENVSIYFRNLDTSQWVAVNKDEKFAPASMLKVITLITVLRASESNPELLSRRVRFKDVEEIFPIEHTIYQPLSPMQAGEIYTVNTLLNKLIVESDNGANFALSQLMGDDPIHQTYADLRLQELTSQSEAGYSAQEYSRVFRTLYNGTYLSHSLSEQALRLLSNSLFREGIVAGVPGGITVAHKFGVRSMAVSEEARSRNEYKYHELHDCGIVYSPGAPYFLCVMTRGKDLAALESTLRGASEVVWTEVQKAR